MSFLKRISLSFLSLLLATSAHAADNAQADLLQTVPGFKVDVVLKAEKANGSWINLGVDEKGRLLLSGQNGQAITRVTLKDGVVDQQEILKLPVSEVMGTLFAFDSLYVNASGKGPRGGNVFGLFRLKDTKGDGNYDSVELLHEWRGGNGEHGAHGIVLGPDKKLYVVVGNFVDLGNDMAPVSPHRNYADDLAMPRAEDGNGFGSGKKPPGGSIVRLDPDGKNPQLFAAGERNTYDIAFNADGELFGFDSDMEWDWGMPWYRPIRIFHAPSGADQGFREGSAKWPEYYMDSLPAAVTVGIGCPTGVAFGTGAKFPAKYQKAMYVLDWTYGRLIAVHLTPDGASYKGTWENFVAPKSLNGTGAKSNLNLTDVVIGKDGAMYFTTGGRNTGATLYRVTYTGEESTAAADLHDATGADARALRHKLEAFHGKQDTTAIELAWANLNSADRFIRYAARLAIESQPIEQWKDKALAEKQPSAGLTALLALARYGGKDIQPELLKALARFPISSLTETQQIEKLRVIEVTIARQGKPTADDAKALIAELDPAYPAKTEPMNRELSEILLALDAPDAIAKTVKLLTASTTQEEQVWYVLQLRTAKTGWTPELRQQYFTWWTGDRSKQHPGYVTQWFKDAGRDYSDGASFPNFLKNLHADARKTLSPEETTALEPVLTAFTAPGKVKKPAATQRSVVKNWTMADLEPALAQVGKGRNFQVGKNMYEIGQCAQCHKFGNDGGAVGPDLTAVSSRFQRRDILESIIDPSKVVSEQYQNTMIGLKNDTDIIGRVLEETADKLVVQQNPLAPDKTTVKKSDIKTRTLSKVSPMPQGLADILTKDEILDLIAYMESAGKRDHPDFSK